MTDRSLMRLDGISKHFGGGETRINALLDVSLAAYPTQVVVLLGSPGSGKNTLLNVISCILDSSSGKIKLDGETVLKNRRGLKPNLRQLRLDKIGFILQISQSDPVSQRHGQCGACVASGRG